MSTDKKILRVVGCFVEHNDQLLMLLRCTSETDPSLWGIPAGKVEKGESDIQAVIREVREETGIKLESSSLTYLGELPIEYPSVVVCFPVFKTKLEELPDISLSPTEHVDYAWLHPKEIIKLPNLMQDVDVLIEKFGS